MQNVPHLHRHLLFCMTYKLFVRVTARFRWSCLRCWLVRVRAGSGPRMPLKALFVLYYMGVVGRERMGTAFPHLFHVFV